MLDSENGLLSPRACRITHGPHDCDFENIADKSIASIRRALASVFSIPDDAEAYMNGSVVAPEYRLRPGDSVEFMRRRGLKAVGDLLTAEQLIERWHIDNDKYRQLLKLGLPTIRFEDDSVRHPEVAVDEWFCQSAKGHRAICEKIQPDGRREETQEQLGSMKAECLSIEDAAKFLGVRVPTVEHLIRTRQLAFVQLGAQRGRVVPIEALRKLVQHKLQPTADELRKKQRRL